MPKFFATCPKGLSKALESELMSLDLGLKRFFSKDSGVGFECSWFKAYEVNLRTRVASRVMKPVLDFEASTEDQIASLIKKHDFSKYIPKGGSFALKVKLNAKSKYKDQRFVMNRIRVGLMEDFEERGRADIKVSKENPSLEIFVGVFGVTFSFSLNLSGAPLSHRGYRLEKERAPLRENLAAGLLRLADWDGQKPLVDFMCGSGTFLIEAALWNRPQDLNRTYAFENWQNFEPEKWSELKKQYKKVSLKRSKPCIYGFDQDPRSLSSVFSTLQSLSLSSQVFSKQVALKDLSISKLGLSPGVVVLNPPYGERLGSFEEAKATYALIGEKLKSEFKGWKAFVLSPSPELTKELKLKAFVRTQVDNGGLDCAFLGYEIN